MGEEAKRTSGFDWAREMWRRRKWLGIVVFAPLFAGAVTAAKALPNIYRSTATVLVERPKVPETFVRPSVTGELETQLQTVSQQIFSRARLGELILRFDLYPTLRERQSLEAAIDQMRRDVHLELKGADQTGGRTVTIALALSYQGGDPPTVALVTNTLASSYVEENLKFRERQATGTAEFLKAQLEETRKRLEQQERRTQEFKLRYMGDLPQQAEANQAGLERLNAQYQRNTDLQSRALERRDALTKQLAEADVFGPDARATRLARLKQELMQLQMRFTDKYPDIIRMKSEIAALERRLAQPTPDAEPAAPGEVRRIREALSNVEAEIKALRAEETALRRTIAAYQARIESAPRREQEFQELSRDYGATKELYYSLLKRYEDAELAENMEQLQKGEVFRILDPAVVPNDPVAPNRVRLLVIGWMLSLAMAAGVMFFAERLDSSFHAVDELRAFTKVPVLSRIPHIATRADTRRRWWRFSLATVLTVLGLAFVVGASFYIAHGNEQLARMIARSQS